VRRLPTATKWLEPVELVARGIAGFSHGQSILKDLVLPAWEPNARPTWPLYCPVAVELAVLTAQIGERSRDRRLNTANWWEVEEEAHRRCAEAAERAQREETERRAKTTAPAHSQKFVSKLSGKKNLNGSATRSALQGFRTRKGESGVI
jgi:hypothetical protein